MGIFTHLFCVDINRGVRNFQDTPGAVLPDVRAPQLYARRHIPGSRNLPFAQLDRVGDLLPDHDVPLFVCAHGGETSAKATDRLKAMGYTQVHNIGGMKRCCGNLGYQGPVEGTGWASGA